MPSQEAADALAHRPGVKAVEQHDQRHLPDHLRVDLIGQRLALLRVGFGKALVLAYCTDATK